MSTNLFADVFPVNTETIPPLFAYTIKAMADELSALGGKLAYRLKNRFGGNWIWCNGQIIGDKEIAENDLRACLKELWAKEETLKDIQSITPNPTWEPRAGEIGDFAARGIMSNYQTEIRKILAPKKQEFGKIIIERNYSLRGWAVGEKPAISISVLSNILHTQNLAEYALGVEDQEELIGLLVLVTVKNFKGEISEITGKLSEHREWLLAKSKDETTRDLIKRAPDDELTVKITTRTSQYIYIASMLCPIVRIGDLQRFGVNSRKIAPALKLDPNTRFNLVREIAAVGKKYNIITDSFNTKTASQFFLTTKEVEFVPELRVGGNHIHQSNQRIYDSLQKYGLFSRSPLFSDTSRPIKIGVINASSISTKDNLKKFLHNLKRSIDQLGFSIESVKADGNPQQKIERLTRVSLEKAVNQIEPHKPDILLVLLPGNAGQERADEYDSMYHALKSHTIRLGIPSQVVYEDTFTQPYAMDNIVLGILAKTRNIPFVLAKPLPYADIVVGIDIARRQKKKLAGSVNATAIARIYFSDGKFLRYVIHDAPIDGETIPPKVLRDLFPSKEFQGKKVIIHRDGLFRGQEKQTLKNWASEIQSEFMLVEVIKSGAPRLYQQTTTLDKPEKGAAFKLSPNEAFLVSSPPPFKGSTPRPLHIRTDGDFPVEKAIHSVLSLTLLHYGSVREPRLPVTIHYSDKIAEFALLGIKPKDLEGDMPFWL